MDTKNSRFRQMEHNYHGSTIVALTFDEIIELVDLIERDTRTDANAGATKTARDRLVAARNGIVRRGK